MGRKLQLPTTAQPCDHVPTHFDFWYTLQHPVIAEEDKEKGLVDRYNQDALMEGVLTGARRAEFLKELEKEAAELLLKMKQMRQHPTPDVHFEEMDKLFNKVALKYFGAKQSHKGRGELYDEWKKRRLELLRERREARATLGREWDMCPEDEEALTAKIVELQQVSKKMQKARRAFAQKRERLLLEEVWQAWRDRNLSLTNRLCNELVRARLGPRKRNYRTLRGSKFPAKDWLELWQLPGCEGGMTCQQVDWQGMQKEHQEVAETFDLPPYNLNYSLSATRNLQDLATYLVHCPKRRASRPGSTPPEVLLMILKPEWRDSAVRAGVKNDEEIAGRPAEHLLQKKGIAFVAASKEPDESDDLELPELVDSEPESTLR